MKKNLLIIASVICAFSAQLTAKEKPASEKESPLFIKSKNERFVKGDAPVFLPKQVIKINLTQLALTNISMQYEFGFHKNFSAALGASYLINRGIPSQFYTAPSDASGYQLPKFGGWSVTPEIRFYPGKKVKHQAPHGFYLAPYFRYSKYSLQSTYIDSTSNGEHRTYDVKASYGGFTAGLMIGSQWIIGKHFSIDWWILGAGAGKAKFQIESKATDGSLNMSQQEQENLKNDITSNISDLGPYGNGQVTVETTSNSAKATVKGIPMTSIRGFGLTLGFVF